jgi:hypothetical protein
VVFIGSDDISPQYLKEFVDYFVLIVNYCTQIVYSLVNGTSSFYHHICRAHIPSSGLDHFEIL